MFRRRDREPVKRLIFKSIFCLSFFASLGHNLHGVLKKKKKIIHHPFNDLFVTVIIFS